MKFNTVEEFRTARNIVLAATDYLMLPDLNIDYSVFETIKQYRQDLRVVMSTVTPENVSTIDFPVNQYLVEKLGFTVEDVISNTSQLNITNAVAAV